MHRFPGHPERGLCLKQAVFPLLVDPGLVGTTCKGEFWSSSQCGTGIGPHSPHPSPHLLWVAWAQGSHPPRDSVLTDRRAQCETEPVQVP